ncbi:ras-related and estrogen-regulated growth inhibitor isoform X2 [Vespula squamosa]|uniref:small monomeric GTPase n=1 Tax=Vespula squamosa TaxID=30214 RepID=A0ABD2AJ46_VESSQ
MWNDGDDHSDETFRIFVWIARLKRLSLIAFMLLSVLLYYVPESRSHVRKACCFLIDFVADGLKFALRATDGDYRKRMKVKRRRTQNEQENQRRRRVREKNRVPTNEGLSWYQEIANPRSRSFGQDGKYQSRRRDQRRYREVIGNDEPPENCLDLSPFLQNQYQQRRAVMTRNDVCSVRLKKEYDRTLDNPLKYREEVSYSTQKFPFEYEEDYAPVDTNIPTKYYDSPSGRFDQNVADIATYRLREIIGDNKFFANKREETIVDLKGETVRKRRMSGLRQMHGDTIPETISCNESSYTSLEAEADDENSQCGNEIATGTNFPKERDVEEATPKNRYKHEVLVDGEPILFEILDSCPKSDDEMPSMETLQWADGLLLVYSITDRTSFNFVRKAKEALAVADPEAAMPLAMVGNKADMVHLRQVSAEEGEILAKDFECWFSEISAAEQVVQVAESFHELCREVLAARRRNKQSLLDRMLGSKATRTYSRGKSDSALPKD